MPRLLAASISSTSSERPSAISRQRGSFSSKLDLWPPRAIEAFGKNSGDGCFAGAAGAAKKVCVRDAVALDGVGERLGNVLLADHVAELLRAVLSGYNLIGHSLVLFASIYRRKTAAADIARQEI